MQVRTKHGSRRTVLAALVLNALLLMLCTILWRKSFIPLTTRLGLGALLAWSLVVTAYAVYTFLGLRSLQDKEGAGGGMLDPLTGLPNRRGLLTELQSYPAGVEEMGRRVRLIDVDLVNLNRINYEFGQRVGDAVLQDIADLLRSTMPGEDLVGRLGGDEFLVVMPQATASEAETLAQELEDAVAEYRLHLGDGGEVGGLKARVSVAAYVPEQASLHETVISAKEATAHGRLPEGEDQETFYHVSRVTLGAFAVRRWQNLSSEMREDFKLWQRDMGEEFTTMAAADILRMLDEKAESHWADFVTAPPATERSTTGRRLAEAVAEQLSLPYRDVMRADARGPETRSVEPSVDATIEKGEGALLVCDVISSGILERRCVRRLSAAGAHVQVAAWAAY